MTINVQFTQEEVTGYWWACVDFVKEDGQEVRFLKSAPVLHELLGIDLLHWESSDAIHVKSEIINAARALAESARKWSKQFGGDRIAID